MVDFSWLYSVHVILQEMRLQRRRNVNHSLMFIRMESGLTRNWSQKRNHRKARWSTIYFKVVFISRDFLNTLTTLLSSLWVMTRQQNSWQVLDWIWRGKLAQGRGAVWGVTWYKVTRYCNRITFATNGVMYHVTVTLRQKNITLL